MPPLTTIISPELQGQRLDKALTTLLADSTPPLSRARIQALLAAGHVVQGDRPATDASRKVKVGEVFDITIPPPEAATPSAQSMDLAIVYEDDDLLVIDKSAGMVVHPAPGNRDRTLVNALLAHCGDSLSGIGGVARPGIVHRLDKDTSGLMVVAKNDLAHQGLAQQFADRTLSRTYQAVIWGIPVPRTGSVDAPIGRHAQDRKRMAVTAKGGKHAVTHYAVLEPFLNACLVECVLETGRTHQIRVHLAHIKHPVMGDPVYGKRRLAQDKALFSRQALHAAALRFRHPRSKKIMRFTSDLPADMAALVKRLRKGGG